MAMISAAKSRFLLLLLLSSLFGQSDTEPYRDLFETDQWLRVPFQEGEKLFYEVNWKPVFGVPAFKAGELEMSIERSRFGSVDTYRIIGWAVSGGTLTTVAGFEIKNYFESHIDRESFRSYRILQKIRQGKRKRDLELTFDYENDRTMVLETDRSTTPPKKVRDRIVRGIPAPAADILSVFYVARLRDVKPGDRFQFHLNEKGEFKKVLVVAENREKITTPVGPFPTIKLRTSGGPFKKGGEFRIWYSTDQLRIPVKFEAEVKIGKVYGNLVKLETPRQTRSLVRVD